jgi:hypothetical protein
MEVRSTVTNQLCLDMHRAKKVVQIAESLFLRSIVLHRLVVKINQNISQTKLLKILIKSKMQSLISLNKGYWVFRNKHQKNMVQKLLKIYKQMPIRMK